MTPIKETPNFSKMFEGWPSPLVARSEISQFCGTLTPKTMANHDSQGTGPRGRVRIGRKIAYEKSALIAWIESRAEALD